MNVRGAFAPCLVLVVASSAVARPTGPARYDIAPRTGTTAWEVSNESQGFALRFSNREVRIVPDAGRGRAWEWSLSLSRYGRPGELSDLAAAPLSIEGHRGRRARPSCLAGLVLLDAETVQVADPCTGVLIELKRQQ